MKKFWLITAALAALSSGVLADSISSGSTGAFVGIPGPTSAAFVSTQATFTGNPVGAPGAGIPFWNDPSSDGTTAPLLKDGHIANIGDVLAGLATGTDLIGTNLTGTPNPTTPNTATTINGQYYAYGSLITGNGDPVTSTTTNGNVTINGGTSMSAVEATPSLEFSFLSAATAYNIALLFADSGNDFGSGPQATTVGFYTQSSPGVFTETALTNPVDTTTGPTSLFTNDILASSGTTYGFYATVCYQVIGNSCTESVTYTTGAGNFSTNMAANNTLMGALGWNHFALFQLQNGEEVLGFTDTPYALSSNIQGLGDFNDAVLALTVAAPEPGTLGIMGLGLAGLGLVGRRRFAKK